MRNTFTRLNNLVVARVQEVADPAAWTDFTELVRMALRDLHSGPSGSSYEEEADTYGYVGGIPWEGFSSACDRLGELVDEFAQLEDLNHTLWVNIEYGSVGNCAPNDFDIVPCDDCPGTGADSTRVGEDGAGDQDGAYNDGTCRSCDGKGEREVEADLQFIFEVSLKDALLGVLKEYVN